MSKDIIEAEGVIMQALPNAMFKVQLVSEEGPTGHVVLCTISGKIRMHYIKLVPGDKVKLELTPYDLTRGRIVYRLKDDKRKKPTDDTSDASDKKDAEDVSETTND